jgi:tRNA U34 5-methylaminomethyl-2-thiouridine-forming methyltransferase MnmC
MMNPGSNQNELFTTQDGSHTLVAHRFGVSYHSKYGAVTESKHVFIQAGFYPSLLEKEQVSILEIGLGTGLNVLLTLIEAEKKGVNVVYEAVEAYPITMEEVQQLNFSEYLGEKRYNDILEKIHSSSWDTLIELGPHFHFAKKLVKIEDYQAQNQFDLIYFDAFAPTAQPELWEFPILRAMHQALLPGGILVTYCAKGEVKRQLKAQGFNVEALPGPPGKREMTRAKKAV